MTFVQWLWILILFVLFFKFYRKWIAVYLVEKANLGLRPSILQIIPFPLTDKIKSRHRGIGPTCKGIAAFSAFHRIPFIRSGLHDDAIIGNGQSSTFGFVSLEMNTLLWLLDWKRIYYKLSCDWRIEWSDDNPTVKLSFEVIVDESDRSGISCVNDIFPCVLNSMHHDHEV